MLIKPDSKIILMGVSGGTGEEDDSLARFGADIFNNL